MDKYSKNGQKRNTNYKEEKYGKQCRTPLQTKVRVLLPITCKQSLNYSKLKYLQNKLGNKLANETMGWKAKKLLSK